MRSTVCRQRERDKNTHTLVIHTPKICSAWLNKANVYTVQSTCSTVYIALRFFIAYVRCRVCKFGHHFSNFLLIVFKIKICSFRHQGSLFRFNIVFIFHLIENGQRMQKSETTIKARNNEISHL